MATLIAAKIGPSFASEVTAASLEGLPFSWSPTGVAADAALPADKLEALRAVIKAHNPDAPGPLLTGPTPSCSKLGLKRAFDERGIWPTVRTVIAGNPDMQEDWDLALEIRITDPLVRQAIDGLAKQNVTLSYADVLALIARANQLVA